MLIPKRWLGCPFFSQCDALYALFAKCASRHPSQAVTDQ
jgi:hypothetical protein